METIQTAICVAIGSELLGESRIDSNSLTISRILAEHGVEVVEKSVVGDDIERIAGIIRSAIEKVDLVVITGGLGPTADDVTRQAVAEALHRRLDHDDEVEGWIRDRFRVFGREMPEVNLVQAKVVEGSTPLNNMRGSAPGIFVETGGCELIALPGVPWEMQSMLESYLVPELERCNAGITRLSRTLMLSGIGESDIEQRIHHLYPRFGRSNITILASYGSTRLVFSASGTPGKVREELETMVTAFSEVLGVHIAGEADSLAEAVLDQLRRSGQTVATAESCTGGLISAALTEVAGSSNIFLGGVVSYSNEAKEQILGVEKQLLIENGAVSEPVARAMAEGARSRLGTDWGISVTGIAGPGGGSDEKPVGLVHWAVAGPSGVEARHRVFPGTRSIVRQFSFNAALDLLRRTAAKVE